MNSTQEDFFVTFPRFTIEQSGTELYPSQYKIAEASRWIVNFCKSSLSRRSRPNLQRCLRATQRKVEKDGTPLLIPDVQIEGWWTNLNVAKHKVIELYRGEFANNDLLICCAGLAYNILRAVGQVGLMGKKQDLIYFDGRFIRHAHGLTLRSSCHANDQAQAFSKTYGRFAYG